MIITKEVSTKWNTTTREWYESKGYIFTSYKDSIIVPVEDLPIGSNVNIVVTCDYCNKEKKTPYKYYLESISKSIVKKHSCHACGYLKRFEEASLLQSNGELNKDSKLYYVFIENIKKDLDLHIKKYGNVNNFRYTNGRLYSAICKNTDLTIKDITDELGYKWDEISDKYPPNYFRDFDNVKNTISEFIEEKGYFPTSIEMMKDLSIQSVSVAYHGGIHEIKRLMGYQDETYVDDKGFPNSSKVEYFVAQFLIKNKIPYKREQLPFEERQFRSDFLVKTEDGIDYHIEVWGYDKNNNGEFNARYNKIREEKEYFYKKYNINLISIEYLELEKLTYKEKEKYLQDKISFTKKKKLMEFSDTSYLHPKNMNDKDILNVLLEYSDDEKYLPIQEDVNKHGMGNYLAEIRKRYDSYFNFAMEFNKKLRGYNFEWNESNIYDAFYKIVENRLPINGNTVAQFGLSGMENKFVELFGSQSYTTPKLKFYYRYINKLDFIHDDDFIFFLNVANNRKVTSMVITDEDIKLAKLAIAKISNTRLKDKFNKIENEENIREINKSKSFNDNRKEYLMELFNRINPTGSDLLPIGFEVKTGVKPQSFMKTFKLNWIELMNLFNKKEEFISTLLESFADRYEKTQSKSISAFCKEISLDYSYINDSLKQEFMYSIGEERHIKITEKELEKNFFMVIEKVGDVPLYNEFSSFTKISIPTYTRHLELKNEIYDGIVKTYVSENEFIKYMERKSTHKSEAGRSSHQGVKYSNDEIEKSFKLIFDSYYKEHGTFPSRREFNKISRFDDSLYRNRFKKNWTEIVNYYGYKTAKQLKEIS